MERRQLRLASSPRPSAASKSLAPEVAHALRRTLVWSPLFYRVSSMTATAAQRPCLKIKKEEVVLPEWFCGKLRPRLFLKFYFMRMEVVPAHMYVYCMYLLDALGWLWASTRLLGMEPGTSAEAASTQPWAVSSQKLNFFVCSNFVIPLQSRTGYCQNF